MTNRKRTVFITALITVIVCVLITVPAFALHSFANFRDYLPPLVVDVPDSDVKLLIKEWSLLLGSGGEVYQIDGNKEIYLGTVGGGDDGYCPFNDGKYEIVNNNDGTVTLRWAFGGSADSVDTYKEKTLEINSLLYPSYRICGVPRRIQNGIRRVFL